VTVKEVVKTDVGNRRGVGVWAFLLALCTAGALTHVGVRMHSIQIAYALGKERKTNTQLQEQRRRLNIEIGMLKAPERIIGMARDELAMGPPAQSDVVRLAPGVTLQPTPAAEPTAPAGKPAKLPVKTKVKP